MLKPMVIMAQALFRKIHADAGETAARNATVWERIDGAELIAPARRTVKTMTPEQQLRKALRAVHPGASEAEIDKMVAQHTA